MMDPGWTTDVQWARALGAVVIGLLLLCGVICAGGPARLAREAEPAARVAAALYCMAVMELGAQRASLRPCSGRGC